MDLETFANVFDKVVADCRALFFSKNDEYARGGDKLHNFKKASRFAEGNCQIGALKGMMLKHTVSVYDMMDDECNDRPHDVSKWREKVYDHVVYLILLFAMVIEQEGVDRRKIACSKMYFESHDAHCECDICVAQNGVTLTMSEGCKFHAGCKCVRCVPDLTPSDSERCCGECCSTGT